MKKIRDTNDREEEIRRKKEEVEGTRGRKGMKERMKY